MVQSSACTVKTGNNVAIKLKDNEETNKIIPSKRLLRNVNTLYTDLNISDQLVNCIFVVSLDAIPLVQGKNFSPGRSLRNIGTNIITVTIIESERIAIVKLYSSNNQLPNAREAEVPIILEPHINPLALAC